VALSLTNLGYFKSMQGHDEEALPLLERALQISVDAMPENPGAGIVPLMSLGNIHGREGRWPEAADTLRRFLDGYRRSRAPEDTDYVEVAFVECEIDMYDGAYQQALSHCRKALELERAEPGASIVGEHSILAIMGDMLIRMGRVDEGIEAHRRARMHVKPKPSGVEKRPARAYADQTLAGALREAGRFEDALISLERARAALVESLGAEHWELLGLEIEIGVTLLALERGDEARSRLRKAASGLEAHFGSASLSVQRALVELAGAELDGGDLARARELVERALTLMAARPAEVPALSARARFVLARSLYSSRPDRARALELARQAEEGLAAFGEQEHRDLEAVRAWLAEPGARATPKATRKPS
jgi:tetratricopeptide (TPR) repeat protein